MGYAAAMSAPTVDGICYGFVIAVFDEEAVLPLLLRRIEALMEKR